MQIETTILKSKVLFSDEDLIAKECDEIIEQYAAMSDAIIIAWDSIGNNS